MSGTDDAYAPEEPTPDISMSLLDIQMPETPESTKGQVSDGDTCRLESPRLLKPVLGKVQAKKRLMAFANKFNVLPKIRNKSSVSQVQVMNTTKDDLRDESSTNNTKSKIKAEHNQQTHSRYSTGNKLRKKTEEKILAIEEIRREESKSKLLLAEAMAAVSLEEEQFSRNNSASWETSRNLKERCKQNETVSTQKSSSKSVIERKKKQHNKEEKEESSSREGKERHESKERYKSPHNREQHKRDRERKDDKCKKDENKVELNRDKKDDGRDKKESQKDKKDEIREKKEGSKDKKEKQNDLREGVADLKSKKDKEKFKDKEKEREIIKYESWTELKNSDVTLDEFIQLRRQENLERPAKNRTAQDYTRYLDQMLMLNNHHLKRSALIAEGLDGPKEFPPESIRLTKRGRQLLYCENPRVSLLLNRQQLFQAVTIDRREKLREICDATSSRSNLEDNEEPPCTRNWYKKINVIKPANNTKWQLSTNVQLPKSKWDSEDEEVIQEDNELKHQEKQTETQNVEKRGKVSTSCSSHDNNSTNIGNVDDHNNPDSKKSELVDNVSLSPAVQPAGNEKLASEYEQFMKMVCTDIPLPDAVSTTQEFTSEKCLLKPESVSNYHEFNIEVTSSEDKCNTYSNINNTLCENQNIITNEVLPEKKLQEKDCLENSSVTFEHSENSILSVNSQTPAQENENIFENTIICKEKEMEESQSIPSDWENVRIKVECLSDENSEQRKENRRKKHLQKKISSSSESSSTSSSSDSEDKKSKRKRKRKLSQDSSSSDSDSSESSSSTSSSSESFSSDSKRKKKKRKKRKIGKRKKKAKRIARIKKRRRRKASSPSSSSESDERRIRRKVIKKKLKKRKVLSEKEFNSGEIVNELSDSTTKHTIQNKLVSMQSVSNQIKEEIDAGIVQGEKRNLWEKVEILSTRKIEDNTNIKSIVNKENQDKATKKFLEEWEVDSVIIAKRLDNQMSEISHDAEKLKSDEQSKAKRMDKGEKSAITNEQIKEKRCNETFLEGKQKIENELEEKRRKKRDKEKKSNTEFLAEWERESERIARQIIQDDFKLSKKLEKHKKEKWGETEFDTLNVPSLTQLENEVNKVQLLADEWEVDSLEAIADLAATKRRNSRSSIKKLEKEVKYDKKTDTYIAVDKESARENRKRIERLCTIRIWEDEEEEGEREAMMLVQEKNKKKKDDWDIEEESFMRSSEKGKDSIDNSSIASATSATTTVISDITDNTNNVQTDLSIDYIQNSSTRTKDETLDKMKEHEFSINKKVKKSRWDIGSQSDEKMELKASVMWEEECAEWSNVTKSEHKTGRTFSEIPEKMSLKSKVKDDISHVVSQPLNIERSSAKYSENLTKFLTRKQPCTLKLEDKELVEQSWSENSNIDIEKPSIINKKNPTTERLKTILDIDTRLGQRNMELYSPSSPAPSQKSEDIEASNGSNSMSLNKSRLHQEKNEELCKMEEQLIPSSSIPLQLKKFHENIYTMSHNVDVHSKTEKCNTVATENSEKLLSNLFINDSCSDVHPSKSLQMDMFAEYETDRSYNNENVQSVKIMTETSIKNDEANEGKTAFKLIPKQFLIRRSNEYDKTKKTEVPLQDPAQQVAALLTIQKKLLQSRMSDSDKKDRESSVVTSTCTTNTDKILDTNITSTDEYSPTDLAVTVTTVKLGSKEEVLKKSQLQGTSTQSKLSTSNVLYPDQSNEYEVQNKKEGETNKTTQISTITDTSDTDIQQSIKSSSKEQKIKSPTKKENDKRYNDRNKDKRDRKLDDRDRIDRRDYKNTRIEYNENKRKASPVRSKRRLIDSPCTSWEREESASGSHSRSWSRSRSKSPRRRDETIVYIRDRDRKLNKNSDHRSVRVRDADDRKERFRSPDRSATTSYSKLNKNNRDEWSRNKYDNMDRNHEEELKPYDPIEILRERNMDTNKYSENRAQVEEDTDQTFWQFEVDNSLRDGESLDSFNNQQGLNLNYDNKAYYRDESLEREIMEGPISSMSKSRRSNRDRLNMRRDLQWVKGGDSTDLERYAHSIRRVEKHPLRRSRQSPSLRQSPTRLSTDRFRRLSRSRSKSWSRSRSRSRSISKSRSRSRSRSRSCSRSRSRTKLQSRSRSRSRSSSRSRSTSRTTSRKRTLEHESRLSESLHPSRSPSLLRDRINGNVRERKEENENRNNAEETGRRIETIVQSTSSVSRVTTDSTVMDSEMQLNNSADNVSSNFQYSGVNESSNDYYYTENNLTYPPCIDESATSSPKRLSLDDRLELELGIKKQQEQETNVLSDYSNNFNSNNVVYPSPPPQQQQLYRRQPTVLQVGNVLQVVPADYSGMSSTCSEVPAIAAQPIVRGSSQVVRVGNVLQVVPTSLDWSSGTSSTVDQPGTTLYSGAPSPSPVSVPISVPVPVPVPLPVPAIPSVVSTPTPSSTLSPVPLPLSVPVPAPIPIPIPIPNATYPRPEITVQQISAQPVYNYEAILETRRKEREERKRLREMRRKEKERRRIERVNRRALRLLEKKTIGIPQSENTTLLDHRKIPPSIDRSVIKALREGDEETTSENQLEKEPDNSLPLATSAEEEEDAPGDDDEDDEEEEAEGEDEDDDYEDPEDDEEEEELDDQKSFNKVENRKEETGVVERLISDLSTYQVEPKSKDWPLLPVQPLKGILISPGFRKDTISNGNIDNPFIADEDNEHYMDKEDIELEKTSDLNKGDNTCENKNNVTKHKMKLKITKMSQKKKRAKKSVQFADGIKPGEGTSPSGGEGDMPSPPPPSNVISQDSPGDLKRSMSKRIKKEKRARHPKTKKKVKVKIIKLKKPRITPLSAMMTEDSDELDDLPPPPPPPGSPPPPHLWPSYLSAYSGAARSTETQSIVIPTPTPVQAPPPPTPLPLLVPPPPLNYTIQPCTKA